MRAELQAFGITALIVFAALAAAQLPDPYANWLRFTTSFTLLACVVWVIRRMLRYEHRLNRHETQMTAVVMDAEQQRTDAVAALVQHTADIAADLALANAKKVDEGIKASEERHAHIDQKLDEVLDKKATERAAEQRHESIKEQFAEVLEGQEASKPVIEDTHTIAREIADHVKKKRNEP